MSWMRSELIRRLAGLAIVACAVGGLYLGSGAPAAGASATTEMALVVPAKSKIGQDVTVTARLTSGGVPVTSRRVSFELDGTTLGASGLDASGAADFRIRGSLLSTAGRRSVSAVYDGSLSLAPSQATMPLTLAPALITIRTVPALDGVSIRLGQQKGVTLKGAVTFAVPAIGTYDLVPDILAAATPATRADFVKWSDNNFSPIRKLGVEGDAKLDLGLHIAHRGSFQFVDQHGDPVDSSRIGRVILTSTGGTEQKLTSFTDVWLEAASVATRLDGLGATDRNWRVLDVQIAGTNVVNRGQQHLVPAPDAVWKIVVLLYDLEVAPVDALFGSDVHGAIDLVFPDGTVQTASIGAANPTLAFKSLPRGNYTLRLHTAGLGAPTPVALSRDQTASIRVITFVDLTIMGSILLGGVGILLWIGRRQQIFATVGRMRAPTGGWSSLPAQLSSGVADLGAASLRTVGRLRPGQSSAPVRPAAPAVQANLGEPRTLTQARPAATPKQETPGRRGLGAQIAATFGAAWPLNGHAEPPPEAAEVAPEPPTEPAPDPKPLPVPAAAPRFCRRCGNRMPEGKGVCPYCSLRATVRR